MKKNQPKYYWKLGLNIITVLALIVLIYAVRDKISATIDNFREVNSIALFLMIPLQVLNYYGNTRAYWSLFNILGERIRIWFLVRVNLELNFVNNIFPSGGVSGFSYFGVRVKTQGITPGKATLVYIMRLIVLFVSFQVFLIVGLLILALEGQASNFAILIAGSLATLLLVGTFLMAYIIGSKSRINQFTSSITKVINKIIQTIRPKYPETINLNKVKEIFEELHNNYAVFKKDFTKLKAPLFYGLLANLAEIMTIYVVFIAFGYWVNPGAVIIAYAVANFAGLISVLPGGVGIYEALMTGVLATAGIPAGVSIPVTIMYRIVNMLIQLPPGYVLYHKALLSSEKD